MKITQIAQEILNDTSEYWTPSENCLTKYIEIDAVKFSADDAYMLAGPFNEYMDFTN
jgi:hypothetical protein